VDALNAIVIGGGVIGLSGAWRAAEAGQRIAVVDPTPGRGASWVAAGMLAPVGEVDYGDLDLVHLLLEGAARWPAFAADLEATSGVDVGFRPCGTVMVAFDASDRAALDDVLELRQSLGLASRRLSARECRALVPALSPGVRGGGEAPGDHQVNNRRLVEALLVACRRAGVELVPRRVAGLARRADGRLEGVALEDGAVLRASAVLLAAGAHSACLAGVPEADVPPVRPVKGHVVRLRGSTRAPLLERTVRGLVRGRPCYLVPRGDGELVVGATSEERGFESRVQAGAVHALLDDARSLVPGIDELEFEECAAGLRPGSPDNAPFVGWTSLDGLAVATGHYRNGILLAPLTADAVGALLGGGAVTGALSAFGPDRTVRARA
jgi:glycine oxidase